MHSRLVDLARYGACASNDNADDRLSAARGILSGIAVSALLWLLAFALVALVLDGAALVAQVIG